ASWAAAETAANDRFHWHGEVPSTTIRRVYASSRLLVNTSQIEGGANVISEAVMAGLPILAADIDGNVGVLGERYPGYFPVGNAVALRDRLSELATTPALLESLTTAVEALQPRFTEAAERAAWAALLAGLDVT
ncbi:MAG: glycosyltransferase, partial [Acidimicrobiia bacterium]|nr:glycosyltransferase [Acidimicrobiia bacterium]